MSHASIAAVPTLTDEPVLTENARKVLEARYLKKDENGKCLETPGTLYRRVAKTIADVELAYGGTEIDRRRWEQRFYDMIATGAFMPNSPTLMNAGREMGMLSACFVLPVRDSIVDIFNSIKHTALIQKAGGGTGFAFDELRPTGDFIQSSGGTTSGPISFWRTFSEATNAIQQGAFRRGANMGMMYIHHPDIVKFLHAKQDLNQFTNYNISVKVTDAWMEEFLADPDSPHVLRNPRTGKAYVMARDLDVWKYTIRDLVEVDCVEPVAPGGREKYFRTPRITGPLPADLRNRVYSKRDIWKIIVDNAWQTGEPGVVFMDRINDDNPTPQLGRIEATNPCGEQPLLPYEACNLGSINLGLFITNPCTPEADVDWEGLQDAIQVSTRFLDNVIDANNYPLPEIEQICRDNRKIGLGLMGFADALFKLGVAYNSETGVAWGQRLMKYLNDEAHLASENLARERGCFPNWNGSTWHTRNRMMRNAAVTTVAPTGTISIIANCSGGIEPLFSLAFMRNVLKGQRQGDKPLVEVNDTFRKVAQDHGFYSEALIERIAHEGTLDHIAEVPDDIKRVFVCAHDIPPDWHMRMQAAFQKHCDASISKTINFPHSAVPADVEKIYELAYRLRCKGVTVYRDGCRAEQPMSLTSSGKAATETPRVLHEVRPITEPDSEVGSSAPAARMSAVNIETPTADVAPAVIPLNHPPRIEPMDLPEIVSGFRVRQMTPFGNMHVKITVDPRSGRELEVFAQLGKGGDVANSDLEGLCRTASLWCRAGGDLKLLIKQWEGIGSSMQIPTRLGRIMSLPDGLACALKKYMKAKERFGLRALLLGEINLAELDNPNPPPHRPETTPVDRPASTPGSGNGGGNGGGIGGNGGGNGGGHGNGHGPIVAGLPCTEVIAQRAAEATVARVVQRTVPQSPKASAPRAPHVDGDHDMSPYAELDTAVAFAELDTAVAVAEVEEEVSVVTRVELRASVTMPETTDESLPMAVEKRALAATDLAAVLGEVRHTHDSALYYKLMCPECGSVLARQEGCRKCPSCGWSAC